MPSAPVTSNAGTPVHTNPQLVAERAQLRDARAALHRMRMHTASLEAGGADRMATEYIKQVLYRRMKALEDDPAVPLFFGRLDYDRTEEGPGETFYIGRRHVVNEAGGDPLVIDWRAPMSLPFYQAKPGDQMGVRLRRRFGFAHGELTAYEDEDLSPGQLTEPQSEILESEIERPRTGPMRDIVATIQPEQDVIVRTRLQQSVCVQGAPGTGKTAVGLHRAAYLLYAYREQLSRSGVMVVGPNQSFLSYIGDVLPALGEIDATSETVESLVAKATGVTVRALESAETAVLKGDARMATVLHRALWSHVGRPTESLVVPRGHRQWRVAAYRAAELVDELVGRGVRYDAARQMLPQRLAHQVLLRLEAAGDSPDDRVQNTIARSAPMKAYLKDLWPAIDARKLVLRLLTDVDFLAEHADGVFDPDEQQVLVMTHLGRKASPRSVNAMRWTLADAVLVDEALDLLNRTPSLGHVIIDEAQDLSAMQLRAVGRRASTGSVTVLGDLAQATTPWASRSWSDSLSHLGKESAVVEELVAGFRVPGAVIEFAARLLPTIAPQLRPPHSVRRSRGDLDLRTGALPELASAAAEALAEEGTVGVIVADALVDRAADALVATGLPFSVLGADPQPVVGEPGEESPWDIRLDLVPASLAKGLEFDRVVLHEPHAIVAGEPDRQTGLRRLYVCLTRAVTSLVIVHAEPMPGELAA